MHALSKPIIALCGALLLASSATSAIIKWDAGADNDNWSTAANWEANALPGPLDVASFGQTGAVAVPDIPTVLLAQPETIGGVIFENQSGRFHTLDLQTHALTVNGPFLVNTNATAATVVTVSNGDVVMGAQGALADFAVGRNITAEATHTATLDMSAVKSFTAQVDEFLVGDARAGTARGILKLATENEIQARSVVVGSASEGLNFMPASRLELGKSNVILADSFLVGGRSAAANVVIANGGTLQLGDDARRVDLSIGRANNSANMYFPSTFDLRNASRADLHLSSLTLGERIDTQGGEILSGSLWGAASGDITIGTPEQRGNITIGYGLRSLSAQGLADFSGMDTLTAFVRDIRIGVADASTAIGALYLPKESEIDAERVIIGLSNNENSGGPSILNLGTNSVLRTPLLSVGSDMGSGLVQINSGGSFTLGTPGAPTQLVVAQSTESGNAPDTSTIDLRGASATLYLADVLIGERANMPGSEPITGIVVGGNAGTAYIGANDRRADLVVAHGLNAFNAVGTLDLAGMDEMHAELNRLWIGVGERGSGYGTVSLPKSAVVSAEEVVIGASDFHLTSGTSVLKLGASAELLAKNIKVGDGLANGRLEAAAGSNVQIGSPELLTQLSIARNSAGQNAPQSGTVDLRSSHATLYLADVTIAERQNILGSERETGTFLGGNSGEVRVGNAATPATFIVGHGLQSHAAVGLADLSGMDLLEARLDQFLVGTAEGGSASGVVRLPKTSHIVADAIVIGRSTQEDNTAGQNAIYLGANTEINGASLTIGGSLSRGLMSAPVGAHVSIGTLQTPMDVTIGQSSLVKDVTTVGLLDVSGGTLQAHLGTLTIGQKPSGAGQAQGTLLAGDNAEIHAERIVMANGPGSGTLQFGGGAMFVDEVVRGAGSASFDWTGGALRVDRWGAPLQPFDLINEGLGTLAVGNDTSRTEVFGDYLQGDFATLRLTVDLEDSISFLEVHGDIDLSGSIFVQALPGVLLESGMMLPFMSYESRTGAFTAWEFAGLPPGLSASPFYDDPNHLAYLLVSGLSGDANGDGQVDLVDLNLVRNHFGETGNALPGDVDGDSEVGLSDLNAVRNHFGEAAAVPEPAAWWLALLGVPAFVVARRAAGATRRKIEIQY